MHSYRITIFSILLTLFALAIPAFAQDPDTITVETNLVNIGVTVKDRSGNHVTGLTKDNFEIYDNGKKQEVVLFSDEAAPVSYGFVYDLHPEFSERQKRVLESIREFTARLREEDDFFTIVFNKRGSLVLDFVPTVEQVARHLSLDEKNEPNSLYDAIFLAAEKAEERPNTKRTLIVISDGKDDDSHHSFSELSKRLRGLNVQVFSVLVNDENDLRYSDITLEKRPRALDTDLTLDRAALEELSKESGGRAQETVDRDLVNLVGIYNRISMEMRFQYSVGFYPDESDGKWHKLKVNIDHPIQGRRLKLTYRKGYQSAPAP
ncbi:MAG: VWA domain-containing protein [Acidobacteriota bacterium]|nr:MAG: VWA domain-containing protein [Acidobacteriota bacterium]